MSTSLPSAESRDQSPFPTTSWTLIQRVQRGSEADAATALEAICRQYWYPIYAYARRFGLTALDAEDMTQALFHHLISREAIQGVREEKGRMRTFLLAMLRNLVNKQHRHDVAEKRGGEQPSRVSFDEDTAEERYQREATDRNDIDSLFDRAWADSLLAAADEKLRADFVKADNLSDFHLMREFLPLGDNATPYAEMAAKLGVTKGSLRVQIHRMRKRYAALIELEIAQTVSDPTEQKAELRHLMTVIGNLG